MQIKAAIFDVDGTLVPVGATGPSARTKEALRALQQQGVRIIIATGRARFAAQALVGCLQPDYYVAACGNHISDGKGRVLRENCFTEEEMYALVDFFEDYELPLDFIFSDAYYAYVEYEKLAEYYVPFSDSLPFLRNGEDQVRHCESMPCGASGIVSQAQAQQFSEKYGHLGLRFLPFAGDFCDVLRADTHKATAVQHLLERLGLSWQEVAAFGDGANDMEMVQAAGFGVAMADGAQALCRVAQLIAPPVAEDGVAQIVEQHFLTKEW